MAFIKGKLIDGGLTKFSSEYLNQYYIDENNNVYKFIAYCECPSVTLERVSDKQRVSFGINGLTAGDYTRLIKESEEE